MAKAPCFSRYLHRGAMIRKVGKIRPGLTIKSAQGSSLEWAFRPFSRR